MSPTLVSFAAISVAVIAVPGPSVLFAVSRAIGVGRRSALLTVLGNASGVFVQVVLVALGLGVLVSGSDLVHVVLRTAGAAYLVWLGIAAIRHRQDAVRGLETQAMLATTSAWRDGFVVGVTNPKSLVFLAALLPQYVVAGAGPAVVQMLALGAFFCLIAIVSDGAWVVFAAHARRWLVHAPRRLIWTSFASGLVMISLGVLLLLG